MTYTKKQCKEDMILLWGELASTGGDDKLEAAASISEEFGETIDAMDCWCPCCEYDAKIAVRGGDVYGSCYFCPAGGKGITAYCLEGDYDLWVEAETPNERRYYANKILIKAHMIRVGEE